MSDPALTLSAMPGREGSEGAAQVSIEPVRIAWSWNLQGSPVEPRFKAEVQAIWGLPDLPQPHQVVRQGGQVFFWIGPRSWLMFGPPDAQGTERPYDELRDRILAAGGALFDVSDARVGWRLRGPRARDVLATGCPLDLHARALAAGSCAQSLFGHVAALYHHEPDGALALYVARSLADEVRDALVSAAAQFGHPADVTPT